jgi:hypothetical protein
MHRIMIYKCIFTDAARSTESTAAGHPKDLDIYLDEMLALMLMVVGLYLEHPKPTK